MVVHIFQPEEEVFISLLWKIYILLHNNFENVRFYLDLSD